MADSERGDTFEWFQPERRRRDRSRERAEPEGTEPEVGLEERPEEERPGPRPEPPSGRFGPPQSERQKRLRRRAIPLAIVAGAAFLTGLIMAAGSPEAERAERFVKAWADQDFASMYEELGETTRSQVSVKQFAKNYEQAQVASTAESIDPGDAGDPETRDGVEVVPVEVAVETNLFGTVEGELEIPLDGEQLGWAPHLTFPGLEPGERVGRRLKLGPRAPILAADGTPLAEGDTSRDSPIGSDAIDVAGELDTPDTDLQRRVEQEGYPGDQETGVSGLELAFNARLAGKPGGELLAVPGDTELPDVPEGTKGRELATSESEQGEPLKTTIDPELQELTVSALAGRSGGIVVLDAKSGAVKAMAGSAYSVPQPPGSTFKVITTTAALDQDAVKLDETFPVVQETDVGRPMKNNEDEFCGGTFVESFAMSCNTVFGPLGLEVGEDSLVETAQSYGFDQPPSLYNEEAAEAVELPQPQTGEIASDVDLAYTAIGQGKVLATPLNMASIAQTIANRGVRKPTPIVTEEDLRSEQKAVEVTSPENAKVLTFLMEQVVKQGTGVNAALPDVTIAGKTGTAELGPDPDAPPPPPVAPGEEPPDPPQIVDAWFIAFAPAEKPKLALAVMLIDAGADGGEVAAPIAHDIFDAAL